MSEFLKKMLVVCGAAVISAIGTGIGEALSEEILDRWAPSKKKKKTRKKTRCGYASRYKATRAPTCLGGTGCDVCRAKWNKK